MNTAFAAMSGKPVDAQTFESALESTLADGFCDLEELEEVGGCCMRSCRRGLLTCELDSLMCCDPPPL